MKTPRRKSYNQICRPRRSYEATTVSYKWKMYQQIVITTGSAICSITRHNIFSPMITTHHYRNKHFSFHILSHSWRRQLGIRFANVMRLVGDAGPPIQLHHGLEWKLLLYPSSYQPSTSFRSALLFYSHYGRKIYTQEHAKKKTLHGAEPCLKSWQSLGIIQSVHMKASGKYVHSVLEQT
jgi:hypothetical protein